MKWTTASEKLFLRTVVQRIAAGQQTYRLPTRPRWRSVSDFLWAYWEAVQRRFIDWDRRLMEPEQLKDLAQYMNKLAEEYGP